MKLTPLEPWIAQKIACWPADPTLERLRAYQLQKLQETLQLVRARSPFYRRYLAGAPAELTGLADLRHFPFTTAQDIRQQALQFLCVSQSEIERVVTLQTSGTTGQPKRLNFTKEDQELTLDFFHIGMATFTDPADRVLILLPGERPGSVGDLLATSLARLGAAGLKHGPGQDPADTLAVMAREQVTGLVGAPTQVLALARQPAGHSRRLKSVLLTTDHVPQAIVKAVEQAWICRVYNHYGMTEMGLGGGVECQARRGYHLREADLYVEIIDPVTGNPLPAGERGEIVFTTLTRRGMPLIRYRTGDISRFIPGDCPCGTVLPTLERVRERVNGRVNIGADQSLTMPDLDEALFPLAGLLNFAAAVSQKEGGIRLKIKAVAATGAQDRVNAALRPALESILPIALAQQAGTLRLDLAVQLETGHYRLSPAKRIIRQT